MQLPGARRGAPGARFRARWAALLAVAGGGAGALAFPRLGLWPLAFASVALLSIAVDGRRSRTGAWLGLLYGLAFFVPLLHWTGVYVGAAPWLILAVAEAGFFAAVGAVLPLVQRLPVAPLWVACTWVLQELLRDRLPFGGFPWGRLAFSQASSPLRWFAAVGGAPMVTFAVALCGAGLAPLALDMGRSRRRVALGVLVAAFVPLIGGLLAWPLGPGADRAGRTAVVALVQGNVPDVGLAFEQRARQVLDNHIAQTMNLAARIKAGTVPRPALIVWPENASDVDPFGDQAAFAEIDSTVRAVGIPILVGAILQGPGADHRRNAGILWSPTSGPGAQYIKRHPVPFGEYIPLRGIAKLVTSDVNLVSQDMVGGHGNGLLRGGPFPVGDVICFEVAYDDLVRSSVAAGAQVLVVQTNNATFGHTAETYQQLAMSRLRAVESGRTVLQVATTGKTAVIGPDGGIRQESGALFTPDVIVATIPLRTARTPATTLGAWPEYGFAALAVLAIVYTVRPIRRRLPGPPENEPMEMMVS
ncbi:MAG TPA: apolipoprotein N-acyltransferase [Jatrophihabitantaceae bacterium]|jgi:apolipoprotein N-acyltransferase|nr:apolipoprotein N-acyltransferase [Jatrophihabitantaceae bacterium]